MNGLIHPCFHPEGREPPKDEHEIFKNIENYVLRLFNIVRPKKVLYMAVDGPAPRAKMNQQRMRRFRAAKDSANDIYKKYWKAREEGDHETAEKFLDPDYKKNHDSNVITPGTPFFQRLSAHLREFIKRMQESDPLWREIYVILSDASVPGEGEHKIMDFVRSQRLQPYYDPNMRHVIYGLDADLIFLGLASHEQYFTIMRENILETKEKPKDGKTDDETQSNEETYVPPPNISEATNPSFEMIGPKQFHFVSLWVLRQYLERDLRPQNMPPGLPWNLEYAIDDFVFLCYACGNDFLPSLPGFSIYTGTVREIVSLYRKKLPEYKAYITRNGFIDFPRFIDFIRSVNGSNGDRESYIEKKALLQMVCPSKRSMEIEEMVNKITKSEDPSLDVPPPPKEEKDEKKEEKKDSKAEWKKKNESVPRVIDGVRYDENSSLADLKAVYYKMKFGSNDPHDIAHYVDEYARGMVWVLNYYLHGPTCWGWFYPYHSAPCPSDWNLLPTREQYRFDPGRPLPPLKQLLSVLPPQSAHALPESYRFFMIDPRSPVKDYYPTTFEVDMGGGTQAYKGHVHVPFIDEQRLENALKEYPPRLSPDEEQRNKFGHVLIFICPHQIVTPDNQLVNVPLPPLNGSSGPVNLTGPLEGRLSWCPLSDDDAHESHCYIYDHRNLDPHQDFSWMSPRVVVPEWAIAKVAMGNDQDVFWDKGAIDLEASFELRIMPLALPGIIPGAPITYRRDLIFRYNEQARMIRH